MIVELAQLTGFDGDIPANTASALEAIARCGPDTRLLVFPETYLSGFPTADNIAALAQPIDGPAISTIQQAARDKNISVAIGFAEAHEGRFYNTTALITPEGVALAYRKTHLWASDHGIFTAGDALVSCEWEGLRVGILICYDIEFPETARALAQQEVDLLLVTNGNMDPYGPVHRTAITARAMENQLFAVMTNRCGSGDGLQFAGESAVINPFGQLVASCGRDPQQLRVALDLTQLQASRRDYRYLHDRRITLAGEISQGENGQRSFRIKH